MMCLKVRISRWNTSCPVAYFQSSWSIDRDGRYPKKALLGKVEELIQSSRMGERSMVAGNLLEPDRVAAQLAPRWTSSDNHVRRRDWTPKYRNTTIFALSCTCPAWPSAERVLCVAVSGRVLERKLRLQENVTARDVFVAGQGESGNPAVDRLTD